MKKKSRNFIARDLFSIKYRKRIVKSKKGKEIQITDALLQQAKQGKVIAYKFKGERFDCGSVEGYVRATNYFAKKHKIIIMYSMHFCCNMLRINILRQSLSTTYSYIVLRLILPSRDQC